MSFTLRPYQEDAAAAIVTFYLSDGKENGLAMLPTGSGKSIIIAEVARRLDDLLLIFCPSKEILEQNYEKYTSYGFAAGIYSASAGRKDIAPVTFVTIGSVQNKVDQFKAFKYIMIDECDNVNSKGGMYERFIKALGVKVVGVTATPYRLTTDNYGGSILKFLTRTRPRIFSKLVYYIQNKELFDSNYLAKLKYYSIEGFDSSKLKKNSTGADYDEKSVMAYYKTINFPDSIIKYTNNLLKYRKNVLVFTRFVQEAEYLIKHIPNSAVVHAKTPDKERVRILREFKAGIIKVVCNVSVLAVGFDYPELECIVLARPTMSLRLYYQMIGRGVRPHRDKEHAWVVDMADNIRLFGHVEDLTLKNEGNDKWVIVNGATGKKLTNEYFER
jgi:DNA repair protein RadD